MPPPPGWRGSRGGRGCRARDAPSTPGTTRVRARCRPTPGRTHCPARSSRARTPDTRRPGNAPRRVTTQCGSTIEFIAGGSSSTISSTVTSSLVAASPASRCAPTMPVRETFPARSAFCACRMVTSGLIAGTAASSSPVNGHCTDRIRSIDRREVGADVAAQHAERQPRRAGAIRRRHARVRVLVDRQRRGPRVLDGVAQPVQRADAGIAAPRERETCARIPCRSSGRRRGPASCARGAGCGAAGG